MNKLKLVILISGRGSNMLAILEACNKPEFPAEIVAVISNNPGAAGLEKAQENGIAIAAINHRDFDSRDDFDSALHDKIRSFHPDLICLAGFMRILGAEFVHKWENKIINIHPSLLPDYKGTNTHERVIADGITESGCSVHYVTPELDSGDIIVQKTVSVLPQDTPDTLAARILEVEHLAYPEAIVKIAEKQAE